MPTERFFNLPEEKRRRIVEAAVQEMTGYPLEELSINRIIQTADIPRGSFYQYFQDKNDLVIFILEDMKGLLLRRMNEIIQQRGNDLFSAFYKVFQESVEYGLEKDHYLFFKNTVTHIFGRMEFMPASFNIFDAHNLLEEWIPYLNLNGYRQKDITYLQDLMELLVAVIKHTAIKIFGNPTSVEQEMADLRRKFIMIQDGVLLPGEEKKNVEI